MDSKSLFYRYFIEPMDLGYGYNPVNTLAYAILFVGISYLIYKMMKLLRINIDKRLALSIFPFVIFGSAFRILEDLGILKGYLFMTPGIWFLFLGITILTFILSVFFERRMNIPYHKPMFISGICFFAIVLGMLNYRNLISILYVSLRFLPWLVLLLIMKWSNENKVITGVHMFDAVTTFVSIEYFGYFEQHVLPRFVINLFGTAFSFVILKFIVVVSVLLLLDKYSDDKEFNNWIKIVIGVLGIATGMRSFLALICLV